MNKLPEHVIALPGGSWELWRRMILRGAGFPARKVLDLAAPGCATAADEVLRLESEADTARTRALGAVDEALDVLRQRGEWDNKERRRPLMKALRALSRGKLPRQVDDEGITTAVEAWRVAQGDFQESRERFSAAYQLGTAEVSRVIGEVAEWDLFREAVVWQNRHAVATALDPLVKKQGPQTRNSQRRQHEEVVANYLQRYCVKNDTIGFFGPVGWGRFLSEGEPIHIRPGSSLLQTREVYYETWCVDALARSLGAGAAMRPWIAPRLRPLCHLDERTLYLPQEPALELSPIEARLLAACDGDRPASSIAAELIADRSVPLFTENAVYQLLDSFRKKRIITWKLEVTLELHPQRLLEKQLGWIGDESLRASKMAALKELESARLEMARAAGDAQALEAAMRGLEEVFTRLTGQSHRRHLGETYAARGLVYEDCRRNAEVDFGPRITQHLGPPLSLVLRGARWLVSELTRVVEGKLREIYADLKERSGSGEVESYPLLSQALVSLVFCEERADCFQELEEAFQARWTRVLAPDSSDNQSANQKVMNRTVAEIADRVEKEFGDVGPLWRLAHYFSPDLMIAADSEEDIRDGRFEVILGELHVSNCLTWSCFLAQHPAPDELKACVEKDLDLFLDGPSEPLVLPQGTKQNMTQRMSPNLSSSRIHRYKLVDDPVDETDCKILPAGHVVIEDTDRGLIARTRDGATCFAAGELIAPYLFQECNDILGAILPKARHQPRTTIDDVVISRERWNFVAAEVESTGITEPQERFLAVRRWARQHGMPRFCFYKVSSERKPCYLDFDSPIYVDIFVKMLRGAGRDPEKGETLSISEMLPRTDQTWLVDAEGNRYTCELRMTGYAREPDALRAENPP